MIFISTGGFSNKPAYETAYHYYKHGIENVELSGGLYHEEMYSKIQSMSNEINFRIHNYFPPPEEAFTFNLASLDATIHQRSLDLAIKAISWASNLGQSVYSFHAGFLIDPEIEELGNKITRNKLADRTKAMGVFLDSVNKLSRIADKCGVLLLIENNVLSYTNFKEFGSNPMLMVEETECEYVMRHTPDNVQLLVDVGHLKVSANSLGFNRSEFLRVCNNWIQAYHISDNDGRTDSNDCISSNSWFWPHIKKNLDYYSLEVYQVSIDKMVEQLELTRNILCRD